MYEHEKLIKAFQSFDVSTLMDIRSSAMPVLGDIEWIVDYVRSSSLLLNKIKPNYLEKERELVEAWIMDVAISVGDVAVIEDFKRHVNDANIARTAFSAIHEELHRSSLSELNPGAQVWASIYRTVSEFDEINAQFESQLKEHSKLGIVSMESFMKLKGKDGVERNVMGIKDRVLDSLWLMLLNQAYVNKFIDPKSGVVIIPDKVIVDEKSTNAASIVQVLAIAWKNLERMWDRSRLFGRKLYVADRRIKIKSKKYQKVFFVCCEDPSRAEICDKVSVTRLHQLSFQYQNDAVKGGFKSSSIFSESNVGLPPSGYISVGEWAAIQILTDVFYISIHDEVAMGLPLVCWVRGYAVLAELSSKYTDTLIELSFAELNGFLIKSGLNNNEAKLFIDFVLLQRDSLDLLDTPLIQDESGKYYLFKHFENACIFVIVMSRIAAIKRRVVKDDEFNEVLFDDKGKNFENKMIDFCLSHGVVAKSFSWNVNGVQFECDFAFIMNDVLFVFECKNYALPLGHMPSLYYFYKKTGIFTRQIKRLIGQIEKDGKVIEKGFGPGAKWSKIVPVVLQAMPWSQGLINDVYFYDASSFCKLFNDGYVAIVAEANDSLGNRIMRRHKVMLRSGAIPTANELILQLHESAQTKLNLLGWKLHSVAVPLSSEVAIFSSEWTQFSSSIKERMVALGLSDSESTDIANHFEDEFPSILRAHKFKDA